MHKLLLTIAIIPFLVFSPCTYSKSAGAVDAETESLKSELKEVKGSLKILADDAAMLRRDQLNYRLEKDILKEAYASNLQSINIITGIVFGVVTLIVGIFGYLGVRNIKELKAEFEKELEDLRKTKLAHQSELTIFREKQSSVERQVGDLAKTNEEQDRRLKFLELMEKIAQVMQSENWRWAQEYIGIALAIEPNHGRLLAYKAACHGKLGEFAAGIDAYKKALGAEPGNLEYLLNLLEILAITGKKEEFTELYAQSKAEVDGNRDGALIAFLSTFLEITATGLESAKAVLKPYVEKCDDAGKNYLGRWQDDEVRMVIKQMPPSDLKTFAENVVQFFKGGITKAAMQTVLAN